MICKQISNMLTHHAATRRIFVRGNHESNPPRDILSIFYFHNSSLIKLLVTAEHSFSTLRR